MSDASPSCSDTRISSVNFEPSVAADVVERDTRFVAFVAD
jgi:hypothetical protein